MQRSRRFEATRYFSLPIAQQMAEAADLAYAKPDVVERTFLSRWKSTSLAFFDVESTQCFVAADRDSIVVSFRGTEGNCLEDWIIDLDFDLIDGPCQGRVHAGFYDGLSRVWHLVDKEVQRLQAEGRRQLWVTGHSLGAALATLAAARWCDLGRPVAGLYTFGQPRTGDAAFARNFDFAFRPHTFRVVNNLDIVTRTPPRSLSYRHVGTFIYLNDAGQLVNDIGWWRRFLTGWHGAIETILDWGREGMEDHRMEGYRKGIETALRHQAGAQLLPMHQPSTTAGARQPAALRVPRRRAA